MSVKRWADLKVGDEAFVERVIDAADLALFAEVSGHRDPAFLPEHDPDRDGDSDAEASGLLLLSLFSGLFGEALTGPGTRLHAAEGRFLARARRGDRLTLTARVETLTPPRGVGVVLFVARDGERLFEGRATLSAPEAPVPAAERATPRHVRGARFDRLISAAAALEPLALAVVAPEDPNALGGAFAALDAGLAGPILIGCPDRIAAAAAELGRSLDRCEIVAAETHDQAAAAAVALVREGRAKALMKGHLHTDEFLKPVLAREGGLRTRRRLTHCFVMDAPSVDHLLFVTDAAINIAPGLTEKVDIVQNAIDLARALGLTLPKVGVLSAVETVTPAMPSTVDAAILSKMAERGQITGGVVDGPLAMDNAIDPGAAATKGLVSQVAGRAEVLIAPNIEAGT